ncbi:MAG: pyridoxal-dependent decarboxylase [Armatimonadota bacterium]|nr:pyridoxal-dependent decarboxylase [Armatimonadota bacterium]MDR5674946.1 pyridoxal-dependent decarboxylase [Armatimonadota bacterium]MDR5688811.1 pyridoxal-dependent decarboxylase [Armatimonadota bacterium]MDR7388700.1 pyridoxal-dependent decarboxylase [Armatimonadota bacterium]MDR7394440.1 pyridoxal-dependent decarboxylase [Armatimonadota bacterium]
MRTPLEVERQFASSAARVVDWIQGYFEDAERYPVLSRAQPGQLRSALPASPPFEPEPFEAVWEDFQRVVLPAVTHWNHPAFFAYFAITGSAPGVLGEMLSAALNVNGMLWRTCPAATELEQVALDWLRQMLGLPEQFGVIMDTASVATLCAVAAAREALGLDIRTRGMAGRPDLPRLRLYTSEQAHSSVEKAAIVLGLGQEGVRKVPTDEDYRMRPDALEDAIREDVRAGWRPVCVVATVGTTSTTSVDPVDEIAAVCERYGVWLHVDAAYGGAAAILPEMRWVLRGCERADSFLVNPHKWLFTPIDCTAFYTRRPDVLRGAFSLVPAYLQTPVADAVNFMDYGIQLGRRFRALKLWMVIRMFGVRGLQEALRGHLELARQFADWVDASEEFERVAPVPFSTVCFRHRAPGLAAEEANRFNERLLEAVNATGEAYLSHTVLRGRYVLRLAVGNLRTQLRHVRRCWELLQEQARKLQGLR